LEAWGIFLYDEKLVDLKERYPSGLVVMGGELVTFSEWKEKYPEVQFPWNGRWEDLSTIMIERRLYREM
jgi:hypothetical protein